MLRYNLNQFLKMNGLEKIGLYLKCFQIYFISIGIFTVQLDLKIWQMWIFVDLRVMSRMLHSLQRCQDLLIQWNNY